MDLVTLTDVRAAAANVKGRVVRTPLLAAAWASGFDGPPRQASRAGLAKDLWLKPESLQPVGAFKLRGAYHAVASLPPDIRNNGVVGHSSGNHAQALAYAARDAGIPCAIVMPAAALPAKIAATRALGAEVVLVDAAERLTEAQAIANDRGMTLIPPFDHPHVIAGQGTVGLEIVEDLEDVASVLVPVGGGGLASGVAVAVKSLRPDVAVVAVEPEIAGDAAESFAAGELRVWPLELTNRTIADGLRTNLSDRTFAHLQTYVDDVVTVSEKQIEDAMRRIALDSRLVAEPSGAVSVAGYLAHRDVLPPGKAVAVISGGNVDPAAFAKAL
jgi:threonine dehydratase